AGGDVLAGQNSDQDPSARDVSIALSFAPDRGPAITMFTHAGEIDVQADRPNPGRPGATASRRASRSAPRRAQVPAAAASRPVSARPDQGSGARPGRRARSRV